MKNLIKLFSISIVLLAFSAATFAQSNVAVTNAEATVVAPITIAKTVDLNFGNVFVGASNGTVAIDAAGTRTASGGAGLPATVGTVTAAAFTVTGTAAAAYNTTVAPASINIFNAAGTSSMAVDTWTLSAGTGTIGGGGTQAITVGGTLHLTTGQATGVYNSTNTNGETFTVTVNYP